MSNSLRRRMTLVVIAITAPAIAALAIGLYHAVASAIWSAFDREIADSARMVADMVEFDAEDGYEMDVDPAGPRASASGETELHFQLWLQDGSTFVRAGSLDRDLPSLAGSLDEPVIVDGSIGTDTPVRIAGFEFMPRADFEDVDENEVIAGPAPMTVAVARATGSPEAMLARLAAWFWVLGTGTVLLASGIAGWLTGRGLRPIDRVAAEIDRIDHTGLDAHLSIPHLPTELRPLVVKLNELLARLHEAFRREQQLTADVAHELRTPLAVLLTEVEVALRRERNSDADLATFEATRTTVVQTSSMVENLLALARSDAGDDIVEAEPVALQPLVEECWQPLVAAADQRRLGFESLVGDEVMLDTDAAKLRIVVSNLLGNACEYATEAGRIEVRSEPEKGLVLEVRNTGGPISEPDRARLFDRFWRADRARSAEGSHVGLGLALVRSLCEALGYEVSAHNDPEGWVAFRLERVES